MLTSFLLKKAAAVSVKYYQNSFLRGISGISTQKPKNISEGQAALDHVDRLCKEGQYREALKEINFIEEKYPDCTKAAKYYKGEAAYALLEKMGHLKNLTPSV
jgi:hypothetical protein